MLHECRSSLVTLGLNREICHRPFRMNERRNSLFTAASRGFRTPRFSRAEHEEVNHGRLALKVSVTVCDLNFLPVLGGLFPSFFPFIFDPRGNAVCREHECEVETFRPDVGLAGVNPRVNFRPTWETVARWKLFRINDLELEGTTQRIFPGSAGARQHRIMAQHLRVTDTWLEVTQRIFCKIPGMLGKRITFESNDL